MTTDRIETARLTLVAATPALCETELTGADRLALALGVALPADWPPSGGEYDRDAIEFFLARLTEGGAAVAGWYGWYAVLRATGDRKATLVANGGYLGPPDAAQSVEIGYSVAADWRRRGLAAELTEALVQHAVVAGAVTRVLAHTRPENAASIAVLRTCGFQEAPSDQPAMLRFERQLSGAAQT